MRYLIVSLLLFGLFILPYSVEATSFRSPHGKTRVRGNVYDLAAGNWVQGTPVTVICNGVNLVGTTTTTGLYVVDFDRVACPKFSMVSASVTHGGETLAQSVQVSNINTATMDFNFGAAAVPEMGVVTGLVAAASSGALFLKMKRYN